MLTNYEYYISEDYHVLTVRARVYIADRPCAHVNGSKSTAAGDDLAHAITNRFR